MFQFVDINNKCFTDTETETLFKSGATVPSIHGITIETSDQISRSTKRSYRLHWRPKKDLTEITARLHGATSNQPPFICIWFKSFNNYYIFILFIDCSQMNTIINKKICHIIKIYVLHSMLVYFVYIFGTPYISICLLNAKPIQPLKKVMVLHCASEKKTTNFLIGAKQSWNQNTWACHIQLICNVMDFSNLSLIWIMLTNMTEIRCRNEKVFIIEDDLNWSYEAINYALNRVKHMMNFRL